MEKKAPGETHGSLYYSKPAVDAVAKQMKDELAVLNTLLREQQLRDEDDHK